jgi:predicted SnoaL-like aldol condensation-catalyzing enzyme
MSIEENKTFVRRHFEEFVNQKNLEVAHRNFASDYREHGTDAPAATPPGPDGPKKYLAAAFKRYPDLRVVIEDIIAEGDKVAVRNRWQATDAKTGSAIEFTGIVIWRIAAGKLAERWAYLQIPHPVN